MKARPRLRYDPRAEQAEVDADLMARQYTGPAYDLEVGEYRAWVRGVPGGWYRTYAGAMAEATREHARTI